VIVTKYIQCQTTKYFYSITLHTGMRHLPARYDTFLCDIITLLLKRLVLLLNLMV